MPGVRLNVKKTSVSTNDRMPGLHTTVSSRRVTNTVDLPCSGLSYSTLSAARPAPSALARKSRGLVACLGLVLLASSAMLYLTRPRSPASCFSSSAGSLALPAPRADRDVATLERGIAIAAAAHAGQVDNAGAPYIFHPLREQRIVSVPRRVVGGE